MTLWSENLNAGAGARVSMHFRAKVWRRGAAGCEGPEDARAYACMCVTRAHACVFLYACTCLEVCFCYALSCARMHSRTQARTYRGTCVRGHLFYACTRVRVHLRVQARAYTCTYARMQVHAKVLNRKTHCTPMTAITYACGALRVPLQHRAQNDCCKI